MEVAEYRVFSILGIRLREETMKKIAAFLMLSTCLLIAPAAWATWGNIVSTGAATGIGNPSCAPVSTLSTGQGVRGAERQVRHHGAR
jgi:hypothetical protein